MQPTDTIPLLNDKGIKRVQGIFGALLYVGISVNNKILVTLSANGAQQAASTEEIADAIEQLLDYLATYPDDGIIFRRIDMILAAHTDTGFLKNKNPGAEKAYIYYYQRVNPNQNSMGLS